MDYNLCDWKLEKQKSKTFKTTILVVKKGSFQPSFAFFHIMQKWLIKNLKS